MLTEKKLTSDETLREIVQSLTKDLISNESVFNFISLEDLEFHVYSLDNLSLNTF